MISFENQYVLLYAFMAITALFFIKGSASKTTNVIFVVFFSVLWLFLFGLRDYEVGSDTFTYINSFSDFSKYKNYFNYQDFKDFGYYLFLLIISKFTSSERVFIFIFDLLIIIPLAFSFIKIDTKKAFFLFFLFCSFFFFKSIGINIMRQGVSISFFLLGLVYFMQSKRIYYIPLFFIAFSFHASIFLPIFIYILSKRIKSPKLPLILYLTSILLSVLNFDFNLLLSNIPLLSFLFEDRLLGYFNSSTSDYQTGFRLSFVLFNTIFAFVGYYFHRLNVENRFKNYNTIFYTYLFLSANFFLMFNIPYSDRSGLLSWIFIPFLLYPFIINTIKLGALKLYVFCIFIFIFFYII